MAVFVYQGILIGSGKPTKGVRDAENAKSLRSVLRKDGILLTEAREESEALASKQKGFHLPSFADRVSTMEVAIVTRQLSTLLRAGIPLFESMSALVEQVEKASLKHALTNIREQIREGISFAKALEGHPKVFPSLYVSMVRAGEASGTLEAVLDRVTTFMESQARLKDKVTSAMMYPALMFVIGSGLISVLMVAVVPNITQIFQSMDQALPWYTQLLIGVSSFMSSYWYLLLGSIGIGVWRFRHWHATAAGRYRWDGFIMTVPILGKVMRKLAISRFSRTLATLLSAGVALLTAMDIVRGVLGNAVLEKVVAEAIGSIREGQSIAEPLKKSGQFPAMVTQMISIGERTGQLENMLENVGIAYDADVESSVQRLTSLLEPLMIVFMGGSVAFIAFAILMPLMQISSAVG